MSKVDPKRATAFIAVFAVLAALTYTLLVSGHGKPLQPESGPLATTPRIAPEQYGRQDDRASSEVAARRKAEEDAAAEHAKYLARYLNSYTSRKSGTKTVAIAVVSETGAFNYALNTAVGSRFKTGSVGILTSFFRPQFVTDGLFANAMGGSTDVFDKLDLSKFLDVLLLGHQEVQYSTDSALENVMTANMRLEITAFSMADGHNQSWRFVANGAGFKQAEARAMAEERLLKQIASDTKMSLSF